MTVSKRAWNSHNKKRKATSMEGAPQTIHNSPLNYGKQTGGVTRASLPSMPAPKAQLKVNVSPSTGWMKSNGQPLKKATKKRK